VLSGVCVASLRTVTYSELEAFHASASPLIQMAIELFLLTGASEIELLTLSWRTVWSDGARIVRRKSGRPTVAPMDAALERVLQRARARPPNLPREYVLRDLQGRPLTLTAFRAEWRMSMRKWCASGGEPFALHDLKRRAIAQDSGA